MAMKQRNIHSFFLCIALFLSLSAANRPKMEQSGLPMSVSFGVKIGLFPTGKLTQYALVYYRNNKIVAIYPTSLTRLINIGMGNWPLPNSSVFHNYFKINDIKNDTLANGTVRNFQAAFDSLWKVQFSVYPYNHQVGEGWSRGDTKPSLKQQAYLYDRYGVRGYDQEYYCDTSFFRLIKDVTDPSWIAHYKSLQ